MIIETNEIQIKNLDHLSPSQFYTAIQCPYKIVLGTSYGFKQIMPLSPNAYLGGVLHKMIELISKGIISDDSQFDFHWKKEIEEKEKILEATGLSAITPLKYFADGFALKKIKVRNLIKNRIASSSTKSSGNKKYLSEERLSNEEKTISGVADLIIEDLPIVTIIDFKTGGVFNNSLSDEGEQIVKEEYIYQLKLYCYLYYLKHKLLPSKLFIVTLDNSFIDIPFTLEDCKVIYDAAIDFLKTTNSALDAKEYTGLARCSTDNCKYCAYRPACKYYSEWLTDNFENTKDLKGKLLKVNIFGNNTIGIELNVGGQNVLVNGFKSDFYSKMEAKKGMELRIYNLKKSRNTLNATVTNYTIANA